ncbi:MAG TPA: FAD:protein FMN transferase [Cellvibrio sp.]|nr:FAD:protein FMN transferase [Cellvibrio sp.]
MQLHSIQFKAMGSLCELKLYLPDDRASQIGQGIIDFVKRMEAKYSRYQADSITSRINAAAGKPEAVELDEETARLIDYAAVLHQQSDGLFDITSGILRKAWNFKSSQVPSTEQLAPLLPLIGWHLVEWQAPFIRLPQAGMEIDFGGYVKEYIADAAANLCREQGVEHGLVNLGGDIHVIGPHPDGAAWQVGIQHPRLPQVAIATVPVTQGAITTSGDYERFMMVDGVRYSHLLNPFTGQSIQPFYASASVVAPQCIVAGSFTTIALLKSQNEPDWLAEIGLPYLAIDQQMHMSGSIDREEA